MNTYISLTLACIILALVAWSVASYFIERSVKTPDYTVIAEYDGYEVRTYGPYLTAQVEVPGTHEEALNEGFRILAAYIFGANVSQASIAMTAPVLEGESQKIAMTAPVLETGSSTGRIVSFIMPEEYTLETLPKPTDSRIAIVSQESRKVAALRFSWSRSNARVEEKKEELLSLLARDGMVVKGGPEYAGYDAPFTAPWMTRNEILIEVE